LFFRISNHELSNLFTIVSNTPDVYRQAWASRHDSFWETDATLELPLPFGSQIIEMGGGGREYWSSREVSTFIDNIISAKYHIGGRGKTQWG
jgi:hypothetical protein